jgi:hypothetical protein
MVAIGNAGTIRTVIVPLLHRLQYILASLTPNIPYAQIEKLMVSSLAILIWAASLPQLISLTDNTTCYTVLYIFL